MSSDKLKTGPIRSFVDSSFFHKFSNLKLDEFKLDSSKIEIVAIYNINSSIKDEPTAVSLTAESFGSIENFT